MSVLFLKMPFFLFLTALAIGNQRGKEGLLTFNSFSFLKDSSLSLSPEGKEVITMCGVSKQKVSAL